VSGFAKKSEKTPRQEIDVAETRRQDYLSRRKEDERPN
jgi:phage-related protein